MLEIYDNNIWLRLIMTIINIIIILYLAEMSMLRRIRGKTKLRIVSETRSCTRGCQSVPNVNIPETEKTEKKKTSQAKWWIWLYSSRKEKKKRSRRRWIYDNNIWLRLSQSHGVFVSHSRPFCDICHQLGSLPSSAYFPLQWTLQYQVE